MSALITAEQVHRTAAILEGILDELSWPEDAEHILHIQNTLDIIQTGTFRKLASLAERGIATGAKEPSLSKMPASQISLSSAVVHEPSSDEGLLSTSNNDLKEDVEGDVPAGNHSEGTSPCFDAVKEGQESSEHVPLSMLSPSEGASVDPGVQDSMVMKERVLSNPFQGYDVEVVETSFSQNMMDEIDRRISDSCHTSPDNSTAVSPLHQSTGRVGESDTELKVNESQVAGGVSLVKEGWLPGEDCGRQATGQLGTLHELTISEARVAAEEGGWRKTEGNAAVDILYPMRSKESYVELQEAVLKNQLSISALQSPDGGNKFTCEL